MLDASIIREEIIDGIKRGFSNEQIKVYVNPEYSEYQMHSLKLFLLNLPFEQVKLLATPELSREQIHEIDRAVELGYAGKAYLYADIRFNDLQMKEIIDGVIANIPDKKIKLYADPKFEAAQMSEILECIKENDPTMDELKLIADPQFDC